MHGEANNGVFCEVSMSKSSVLMCFVCLFFGIETTLAKRNVASVALQGPLVVLSMGMLCSSVSIPTGKLHTHGEKGNLDYLPGVRRQTNKDHKRDLIDRFDLGTWRSVYTDRSTYHFGRISLHYTTLYQSLVLFNQASPDSTACMASAWMPWSQRGRLGKSRQIRKCGKLFTNQKDKKQSTSTIYTIQFNPDYSYI